MPTERYGKVRRMLKEGKAKVIKAQPFTIQLMYETTGYSQPTVLGLDSGYNNVGFSAINATKELIAGELTLLRGQVERNKERSMYRRQRRNRLRYRAKRFNNRRKPTGWLAPSLKNKLDTHIRLVGKISALVPVSKVVVEVAAFDIQAIKNPEIEGKEYQQGEQYGFWNLREYIFHRDNHQCQNPECKNKAKEKVLQVHHIGFWKEDRSDRPGNLITLCLKCHTPANHQPGKFLHGWEPKVKSYKPETFMSIVRWRLVSALGCEHTYGHVTKTKRIELGLEKSHINDAFCIAGGTSQQRVAPLPVKQIRRNNRSLELFYDAQYIDTRTSKKASGGELCSGRRTRNKNLNEPHLRTFRGRKLSKGRRSIRKMRYAYQPGDTVLFSGQKYPVKGIQNKGIYIKLANLDKPVKTELVIPLYYGKGLCFG